MMRTRQKEEEEEEARGGGRIVQEKQKPHKVMGGKLGFGYFFDNCILCNSDDQKQSSFCDLPADEKGGLKVNPFSCIHGVV